MSAKRLFLVMLLGAALLSAHRTSGSPTALEEEVGATVSEVAHTTQLRSAIGRVGAAAARPFVRSMSKDTRRLVRDLEPAISRAQARDAARARRLAELIARTDSTAQQSLLSGKPITALKQSGEARSLVGDMRQVLAEANAFR